jgi:hypothetical protein
MGAFDNYQPPKPASQTGGAFGNYQPPAAPTASSSSAAPDLGSTALWNKPADTSWSDYFLAHLAKPFQGAGQAADDYMRAITDAGSFGTADRLAAYMGGTNLADERAKTAAAYQRLGPVMGSAASMIGYAPLGELGAAAKIGGAAAPYVGRWAGGVLGSAAEGAGAGALGAAGHDEDVGKGALIGGALGAAGGVPGGVVGRGGALAPAMAADDLKAQAQAAYAPLDNILFHGPSEVHPAIKAVDAALDASGDIRREKRGLVGQPSTALARSTMAEVGDVLDNPQPTAAFIQSTQRRLDNLANKPTASPEDKFLAPKYSAALEDVMQNGLPQTGVPAGVQPSGYAAAVRDAGDALNARAKDTQRLNDWITKSKVQGGPDVGAQARSWLTSDQGQRFTPPGSPQYDALNTLAGTAAGPDVSAAPSAWDIRHFAHPLVGAGLGAALGAAHGGDPTTIAEEALGGLALGYGLHRGVPLVQGRFFSGPAQQRAIDAARTALSTGQAQAPILPTATIRDALRTLIYGRGAVGAFK